MSLYRDWRKENLEYEPSVYILVSSLENLLEQTWVAAVEACREQYESVGDDMICKEFWDGLKDVAP